MEGHETAAFGAGATRRPKPELTPVEKEIRAGVQALAARLTDPDEHCRRAAAAYVRDHCVPEVQALLVERLVAVVRRAGEATATRAADSLARLGLPALAALCEALEQSRAAGAQLRLLAALGMMGPRLGPYERFWLRNRLMRARFAVENDEVRRAVAMLIVEHAVGITAGR